MSTRNPYDDDDAPLGGFDDLAAIMRSMRDEDFTLDEPPADLWSRIEARVALPGAGRGGGRRGPGRHHGRGREQRGRTD